MAATDIASGAVAPRSVTIRRPDDWHVHLRDGDLLAAVLPWTAAQFARGMIMPNLIPPVTTAAAALAYRERILAARPAGSDFHPLMTCYLTDDTDPDDLERGFRAGIWVAAKLYPANATTNSHFGVTNLAKIRAVLERMQDIGMPLLVHGEETDPALDIFDLEGAFIDRKMQWLLLTFPRLRIVFEHITTAEAVDFVRRHADRVGATITPHHLVINRNHILRGGIKPHFYCLPVAKRERHRQALRAAATSGEPCFFLGTDTAPHLSHLKENACGCAGCFVAPVALQIYAQVFAEEGALRNLEAFASLNGPAFYRLPVNDGTVTLHETEGDIVPKVMVGENHIATFRTDERTRWSIAA